MRHYNIGLPEDLDDHLDRLATASGTSKAHIIRLAVEAHTAHRSPEKGQLYTAIPSTGANWDFFAADD